MPAQEEKFVGIVLNVAAEKENDCRLTVLSPEGKHFLIAAGVKKQGAKLKFAAQPFALCEFLIMGRKIVGATSIENFFDLTKDTKKYWAGCVLLKAAQQEDFLLLANCLKELCYQDIESSTVVIYFLLNVLKQSGYALDFNKCCVCNGCLTNLRFVSNTYSGVVCGLHKGTDFLSVDPVVANTLKIVSQTDSTKLSTIKIISPKEILYFLGNVFENKFEKLEILQDYINLY